MSESRSDSPTLRLRRLDASTHELADLVREGRISTLFQPIVDPRSRGVCGFEALTRGPSDSWLHSPQNLFEAAKRKAVFLREALSLVGRSNAARVLAERFETAATPDCEYITSRALNRFTQILPRLIEWAPQHCTLLLFGGDELRKAMETLSLDYSRIHVPNSEQRFLFLVERPQ